MVLSGFICQSCGYVHEVNEKRPGRPRSSCKQCEAPMDGWLDAVKQLKTKLCKCGGKLGRGKGELCVECFRDSIRKKPRTCLHCSKEFVHKIAKQKYCSPSCGDEAKRGKPAPTTDLLLAFRDARKAKSIAFNIEKERIKAEQIKKKADKPWVCCLMCDKVYRGRAMFCSVSCLNRQRNLANLMSGYVDCKECGKKVFKLKHAKDFCSSKCGRKHHHRNSRFIRRSRGFRSNTVFLAHLFKEGESRCSICSVILAKSSSGWNPDQVSIDHIIPLSVGGAHSIENVRLCCHLCNSLKSNNRTDAEVLELRMSHPETRNGRESPLECAV